MSSERIEAIRNRKDEYVDDGMVQISWGPTANETFLIDHIDKLESALNEIINVSGRTGEDAYDMAGIANEVLNK